MALTRASAKLLPIRALTTSPSSRTTSQSPPPESPDYIPIPKPPQTEEVRLPFVKGTLPLPRRVHGRRDKGRKVRPEYLASTAPLPTSEHALQPAAAGSLQEWQRLMAASRRANLAAGLRGLWRRKQQHDQRVFARSDAKFRENAERALAPDREDDRLTRPTVLASTALTTAVAPDPQRFQRAAASRARTQRLAAQKREARRDALMELYINAASFIVDEDHLRAEVERKFSPEHWKRHGKKLFSDDSNAWAVHGTPPNFALMMSEMMRSQNRTLDFTQKEHARTVRRQKKVAEELTGGKLE